MGWLDKIPGAGNLYIGGLYAINRTREVKAANITHVLSVIEKPLDEALFASYTHLAIKAEDELTENLLQHFPTTNKFIQDGLDGGGGVFVHCALGKSRSATLILAYLMSKSKSRIPLSSALAQLRRGRGVCDPNPAFKAQLRLYRAMGCPEDVEGDATYQSWTAARGTVEVDHGCGHRREDRFELKCRKCRGMLATSDYLIDHNPKELVDMAGSKSTAEIPDSASTCAHYFVEPIAWMRSELEKSETAGRLNCPKCRTNVGKYAWQGMQCSCGEWVIPGISLAKGRVDVVDSGEADDTADESYIRQPPVRGNL